MDEIIKEAVEHLRRGGVILYPTDTVWGVGCDATNSQAVERIYALKRSQNKKGMIVLLDKVEKVGRYFRTLSEVAWDLMEYATSPLTLIMPEAVGVAPNLIPEEGTLAVRVPDHEFCRRLIGRLGRPLVSTSANISGEPTPTHFDEISAEILNGVDMVIPTSCEGHPTRTASSIMMIDPSGLFKIIR